MSKKVVKKIQSIEYKGVREWPSVNLKVHPDLLPEVDAIAASLGLSRNEFIFDVLRMSVLSRQMTPIEAITEYMEMGINKAAEKFNLPKDMILKELRKGPPNEK